MATHDAWGGSWGSSWGLSWTRSTTSSGDGLFECVGFEQTGFETNCPTSGGGGGGLDPGEGVRRRDLPAKPLGLPPKRRRKEAARQAVDERVDAVREIHAEIKRESAERTGLPAPVSSVAFKPIEQMQLSEIHAEIGLLLRIQQSKDDEDRLMLLLLAAGS